jgi:GTP-binding protein HflX
MTSNQELKKKSKAVLVGVQLPNVSDAEHQASLEELSRLVKTLGLEVIGQISQKRKLPASGTVLGVGKLNDLAVWTGGPGTEDKDKNEDEDSDSSDDKAGKEHRQEKPSVVVFDCEITPTELHNIEKATGVEVLDRTGVILEIFSAHAKTAEARLQVELAKLAYLAPRLRASRVGKDRQGGGIGSKGSGETSHELDKRRIRDRKAELRGQLKAINQEQANRRTHRKDLPTVALVGYTNAGKSSLMRALTGSDVLIENKLFATLDTTIRTLYPETTPKILITDTVGFIKKLPHDLVASFRSTLDEANNASLLLYTVDASDPTFRSQLQVTQDVLSEINADEIPSLIVLNKIDQLEPTKLDELRKEFPQALFISTLDKKDIKKIKETILNFFEKDMVDKVFLIPFTHAHLVGTIRKKARIIQETHEEEGISLTVRAEDLIHEWISKQLKQMEK